MRPALSDVRELLETRLSEQPDGRISKSVLQEVLRELFDYLEDLEVQVGAQT